MSLDLLPDLVALFAEEFDRDLQIPGFVHLDEPVQSYPTQHFRMGMVESSGTPLPNALVRLAPSLAHRTTETVEHPVSVTVDAPAAVQKPGGAVDDLSVDVELELALGIVADSHRARPRVSFQMR